jgi:hypothetical protein
MARIRNSLLIALVLSAAFQILSVTASQAVETLPDGSWTSTHGSGWCPRPDPEPSTGEPDVTGNGAPSKVGGGSTSLRQSPSESPVPSAEALRQMFRLWSLWFPWTWS